MSLINPEADTFFSRCEGLTLPPILPERPFGNSFLEGCEPLPPLLLDAIQVRELWNSLTSQQTYLSTLPDEILLELLSEMFSTSEATIYRILKQKAQNIF